MTAISDSGSKQSRWARLFADRKARRLGSCLLFVGLAACGLKPPMAGELPPKVKDTSAENAYQETVAKYSDHSEIYDRLNTRMFAAATYQSLTFREARARRMAMFQHQTEEELAKNLEVERTEFEAYHEFFFGAHLNNHRFDDFDTKKSIWRIALITEVGEILPSSVARVGRSDLNMRAFYPYMGEFWNAYRIRFPKVSAGGTQLVLSTTNRITLRVASTLGTADMVFPTH